MKCENLQFNLPVYMDDILTKDERAAIDEHLMQCPLCRQKLADFQALRNNLKRFAASRNAERFINVAVRNRVAHRSEITTSIFDICPKISAEWLQMRLMPYSVGTASSLIFGFALLWSLLFDPQFNSR